MYSAFIKQVIHIVNKSSQSRQQRNEIHVHQQEGHHEQISSRLFDLWNHSTDLKVGDEGRGGGPKNPQNLEKICKKV
jgi:hypothetical protein